MSDTARLIPRMSTTERLILDQLRESELFGLQLVDRSEGALKRGTVYVTLGRMQDKGYVESRTEPLPAGAIGLPRRWYRCRPQPQKLHRGVPKERTQRNDPTATETIR